MRRRHRGRHHRIGEHARFEQLAPEQERLLERADEHRHDRRLAGADVEPDGPQSLLQSPRSGSRCSRWSAASTPAVLAGGSAAVKMSGREWCLRKWMTLSEAAAKPPIEASDLENVPTMMSTSSVRPKCAAVPSPRGPSTPTAWASSIASAAPYFCAILSRFGMSAMSPSIE